MATFSAAERAAVANIIAIGYDAVDQAVRAATPKPPKKRPRVDDDEAAAPQATRQCTRIHGGSGLNRMRCVCMIPVDDPYKLCSTCRAKLRAGARAPKGTRRQRAGAPAPKGTRRQSECGYGARQLRKMSVAERTRFDPARGTLVGLCVDCCLDWRPVCEAFSPNADSELTMRRAAQLDGAVVDYELAHADDDARRMDEALARVLKKRTSLCRSCADAKDQMSPNVLACKREWERMKRDACGDHGCPKLECAEKGAASWICMSADHVDPTTKVYHLSGYRWWSWNGGVEAMRREHEKVQWMCLCCHVLEPTSTTGRTRTITTPRDKRVREKQAYVNAYKLKLGGCQYAGCGRIVTAATVRSFDLDHRDPRNKATHETHPELIHKGYPGGVCGIVSNSKTSLAEVKDALDDELAKCDMLCTNCHRCRKPKGRARWDAS